jgi:antitoxin CptB
MEHNEILKKQLIYRSMHRGTKEMDLLLGNFVKTYINKLDSDELEHLSELLNIEDDILFNWYFENSSNDKIPNNVVSEMLKNFKL